MVGPSPEEVIIGWKIRAREGLISRISSLLYV